MKIQLFNCVSVRIITGYKSLLKHVLLLAFMFITLLSKAQKDIDSILYLQDPIQQLKAFTDWAHPNIFWQVTHDETAKKLEVLEHAYDVFKKKGDQKLTREAWFNIELCKIGGALHPFHPNEAVPQMLKAANKASSKGWLYTEAQCRMIASTILFDSARYGPSFEQADMAYDIFQEIGLSKYPEAAKYIAEIAGR